MIKGNSVMSSIDINTEELVSSVKNLIWAIIRLLQWCLDCIMANEDVSARGRRITDVYFPLGMLTHWCSSELLHSGFEPCNVANLAVGSFACEYFFWTRFRLRKSHSLYRPSMLIK